MNSLVNIHNNLEIEFDVNPIKTVDFVSLKNGLTKLGLEISVEELGYGVVWF